MGVFHTSWFSSRKYVIIGEIYFRCVLLSSIMAEAKNKSYCSVPRCSSYGLKQPYLHFHSFPSSIELRNRWVVAIRREEGRDFVIKRGSSYVCSRHFTPQDYVQGLSISRLKPEAVPTIFPWNAFKCSSRESTHVSLLKRNSENIETAKKAAKLDHDYATAPPADALDVAHARIQQLEEEKKELTTRLSQLKVDHVRFHRFCVSDKDILFYTRFSSRSVFCVFWEAIQPSASLEVYWLKAQKKGQTFEPISPSPMRTLQLVDEFFLFCCRVAAGLQEKVLADMFQVSVSTVSRVIITWANYLYLLLDSLPIWMSKRQVKNTMPSTFVKYCPDVRVIIDCTEVQCQNPSSLTLQSQVFSSDKNTTTLKALIGIAPCSAVTFVSSLFAGSISDRELTEKSGLLDLLEPGDGCMADKGFTTEKMLADHGATLILPPSKMKAQFTKETKAIAQLGILVERAIRRVKEYRIWEHPVPLSLSGTVNQLWTVCCVMTNFQGALDLKS